MTIQDSKSHKKRGATRSKLAVEHTGFYAYLQRYLEYRLIRGYCQRNDYRRDSTLRQFIVWCEARSIADPREVTKPIVERYHRHLFYKRKPNGEPLTFSAQATHLATIKHFFSWLTKQNYLLYNPASDIELPKSPPRLPRTILTVEVVEEIINTVDVSRSEGIRDRAMLEVLYSAGVRRQELAHLELRDVDLKRHTLFVREGKGGRDRVLPLGKRACQWVEKYVSEARVALVNATETYRLFITNDGEPFTNTLLSHWVRRYLNKHGVGEGGAHLFRHACATHMLENGADIRFIQVMLGHAKITTTQVYTQVSIEKLREIHTATHPAKINIENTEELLSFLAAEANEESGD